ncbi:MAG: hypothetical protein WCP73_04895 [Eubacteriales bacterium]
MEYDEEVQQELKSECPIADSELCNWTGKDGCMPCYIRTLKYDEEKEKALKSWRVMLSNLPRDIDSLHESKKCVLCKGEPNDTDCYATVDMAHPEPKTLKGMIFGFGKKVRTPVGSLVTIHMSSCNSCKKKITLMDSWMWILLVGFVALAFVLVSIPAIVEPLININQLLPVLFVILLAVIGYVSGKSVTTSYRKKISSGVKTDLSEIPLIRMMLDRGWFYFQDNKGQPKLFFKKKKTFGNFFCATSPEGEIEGNVEK